MNSIPEQSDPHDLEWQAFRYVSEEMSSGEREAFEALLAESLDACEALARVTQLALASRTVLADQNSRPALRSSRPAARRWSAAVIAAAALALLLALLLLPATNDRPNPGNLAQAATVLSHWNDAETAELDDESDGGDETSVSEFGESGLPQIPGWMVAAVSIEALSEEESHRPEGIPAVPELQDN